MNEQIVVVVVIIVNIVAKGNEWWEIFTPKSSTH